METKVINYNNFSSSCQVVSLYPRLQNLNPYYIQYYYYYYYYYVIPSLID
jgi:hypothetical protein